MYQLARTLKLGHDITGNSTVQEMTPPTPTPRSRTKWAIKQDTCCNAARRPTQTMALPRATFYNRSIVPTRLGGEAVQGVHNALDLT